MSLPKFYRNLQQLSPKLRERFGLYLQSPFHHSHGDTVVLWQVIAKCHPDYGVTDEALFSQAFPGKVYDNARLRVLRTYLVEHLEKFLVLTELESDKVIQHRLLRRAAYHHGLPSIRKEAWDPIARPHYWELDQAVEEFFLEQDKLVQGVLDANRGSSHDLTAVLRTLDSHYVITRLKYLCVLADPMTRRDPLPEDAVVRQVVALYKALDLHTQPLAAIYFHLLQLFVGKDPSIHIPAFKAPLEEFGAHLDPAERLNLYTYWFNYLNHRHRAGIPGAVEEIFALYEQMISLDILFVQGSFAANHFHNIIKIASMLGKYDWAHAFLEDYQHRLLPPWRITIPAYCNSYLLFAQGRYVEAKRLLLEVEFHDPEYKINHQMLLLRIYYETDDFDGMVAVRDAMKIFLYRNKALPTASKQSAANFSRFALRLFNLKVLASPQRSAAKLYAELQRCSQLRDRNWLYNKVIQLMGNPK